MQALKGRSFTAQRPVARRQVVVRAAVAAAPASLPVKAADGADAGSATLALKVAPEQTAKGLVHRYLVYVRQNARRVRRAMPERRGELAAMHGR
jgi:large subunit ribosomal protein L4